MFIRHSFINVQICMYLYAIVLQAIPKSEQFALILIITTASTLVIVFRIDRNLKEGRARS